MNRALFNLLELIRRWMPPPLRRAVQRWLPLGGLKQRWRHAREPLASILSGDENLVGIERPVGIVANRAQYHCLYVRACLEMGVPFRVIDLSAENWLEKARSCACTRFLVWPDATESPWAQLFKDRCELLAMQLGMEVYPGHADCWVYENKYRLRDWLIANDLPHPRTWVFTDREAALSFADQASLPLVMKTGFGAAATGVQIIRHRAALRRQVKRAFGRGFAPDGHDRRDLEWGRVLLQEYLPDVVEWRLVRIGESYFGHPKGKRGDFHSGSGRVDWTFPQARHLDLLHQVCEKGGFSSMAADLFETPDGRLLINELQTVFGASTSIHQMMQDGKPGRVIRQENGSWLFESGDFARNCCANLRVLSLIERRWSDVQLDTGAPERLLGKAVQT
ncbi:MAG: hypothetical protein ACXIUL_00800 [Wenzhouxiangella sp.]